MFHLMKYFYHCTHEHSLSVRDVSDPDTGIRYPVKFRHPALSGIRYKFAGYLSDSTVRYFFTTMKRKSLLGVYKL